MIYAQVMNPERDDTFYFYYLTFKACSFRYFIMIRRVESQTNRASGLRILYFVSQENGSESLSNFKICSLYRKMQIALKKEVMTSIPSCWRA